MAGTFALPLWLFCLLCWTGLAQDDQTPPKVFSPNPPACAAEAADIVLGLTDFATGIVFETTLCARALGWRGQTIYGDLRVYPHWHNERGCALAIMSSLSSFCGITGSALAVSFDCFNNDQGCGQTIVGLIRMLLSIGSTLIGITASCAPPGTGPPYYSLSDRGIAGFNCYRKIWHLIRCLIRVSKTIELTISLCPGTASVEAPSWELLEPFINVSDNSSDNSSGNSSGNSSQNASEALLDASWNSVAEQGTILPPQELAVNVKPVERRLAELSAVLEDMSNASDADLNEQVDAMKVFDILEAVGSWYGAARSAPRTVLSEYSLHV